MDKNTVLEIPTRDDGIKQKKVRGEKIPLNWLQHWWETEQINEEQYKKSLIFCGYDSSGRETMFQDVINARRYGHPITSAA